MGTFNYNDSGFTYEDKPVHIISGPFIIFGWSLITGRIENE